MFSVLKLFSLLVFFHSVAHAINPPPNSAFLSNKSLRIGVLGGGVSGLSTARTLRKAGYSRVTVLEAGSTVVPIQHAVYHNNNAYDMDLIYIPALNWRGVGVEEKWQNVFAQYGVELTQVVEYQNVGTILSRHENGLFEALASISKVDSNNVQEWSKEALRFYQATNKFYKHHQYDGIAGCIHYGLAYANETLDQWFERNELQNVPKTISKLMGLYGNTPVRKSPACHGLMMLANKLPAILGPLIADTITQNHQQLQLPSFPDKILAWVSAISGDYKNFMRRVKRGYGHLFASIVLQDRIDYRTRHGVRSIEPQSNGTVSITLVDGRKKSYDLVIVSARPNQINTLIPVDHPMGPLYDVVNHNTKLMRDEFGVYGVAIIRSQLSEGYVFSNYSTSTYLLDNGVHFQHVEQDKFVHPITLMRIIKTTTDPIVTVTFRVPYGWQETEQAKVELTKALQQHLGYNDIEYLRVVYYEDSPTIAPVDGLANGWMDKASKAQGYGNIYFVGEIFTGHGVPTTFLGTHKMVKRIFNITQSLHRMRVPLGQCSHETVAPFTLTNIDTQGVTMVDIGSQAYTALMRRPVDAIRVGVHPALLVESPIEMAVLPIGFLLTLMASGLLLYGTQYLLKVSGATSDASKIKNIAIYCVELVVSSFVLALVVFGTQEIMFFQLPKDFLRTTRFAFAGANIMNGLYFCELLYHDRMRSSLRLHHVTCLALYVACSFLYSENKTLPVMRMCLFNLLSAATEQNVFLIMIMHRITPRILQKTPTLMMGSVILYALTRIITTSLCSMAWWEFSKAQSTKASWPFMTFATFYIYPLLVAVQAYTQYRSAQAQLGLAVRYWKANKRSGKAQNDKPMTVKKVE